MIPTESEDQNVTMVEIAALLPRTMTHLDDDRVTNYMDNLDAADPVLVYNGGLELILVNGRHRVEAARRLGRPSIKAVVQPGSREKATQYCDNEPRVPWSQRMGR
jgi:hypothetical protein